MRKTLQRLICLVMTLLLAGSWVFPVQADKERCPVVKVGFFNFSGYHQQDEDGRRSGYGYEFMQKIGNYMDCSFEYVGYELSYSDTMDLLEKGEVDVVTSVSRTPEREEKFLFSDKSIGTNSTMFTVKAGDTRVIAGDYSTYDGLKVGLLDGNSKNKNFERLAEEKGFRFDPVYYETEGELTEALQSGTVDGIVTGSLRATKNEWVIESFDASEFYIVTRKDLPELMDQINHAIDLLDLDEPDWRTALHRKYYGVDSGGLIMLTADERLYLEDMIGKGTPLKVLMNPDRRPYSYFEDGEAKGIIPLIFDEIAGQLKFPYQILETSSRKEYYDLREEDEADIVLDFASDYYLAEKEGYKITDPYINTGFTRLVRQDHEGGYTTVAAVDYSDVLSDYIRGMYKAENIRYYDSIQECVQAVLDREVDATILYTYAAERAMQNDVRNRLSFTIMGDSSLSYAIATNVEDGYLLRSILNKAVNALEEETLTAIMLRETEMGRLTDRQELVAFIYDHPGMGILAVLFLCLFGFVIIILVIRGRAQRRLEARVADVSEKYEKQKLELREALSTAESASQSKSIFLFNMSHDIRTPMNAIIGFADIAEKHLKEPEVVSNAIQKIKTSSDILLKLINDVLDLARIESGKLTLDLAPQNLLEGEDAVQLLFKEDMENAGIHFEVIQKVPNPYVLCDHLRLNQISINLLGNAKKFTPAGGTVTYSLIQDGGVDKDGYATYRLSVKDNGIGMSEDFQQRLFGRFEREKTATVSGIQGTGLGLSIVKRIVEMMDGQIEVKSELGAGTEFVVTFRLQVVNEDLVTSHLTSEALHTDFTGKRILLVEDNELNREIAVELLRDEGFAIEEAEDGTIAVEKVSRAEPGYYDLILMDIQMPVMDGYKATQEIRQLKDPALANIPIIAMTANAFEEDRKRAFEAGMNGHLAKPIDMDMLWKTLQEILG